MKRFSAIILVTVIIGCSTNFGEVIRFPFLISHYNEHKALHPDDSVLAFLFKHYILNQKAESEKDKKSDSKMPFKSFHSFQSCFTPFVFENKTLKMDCNSTRTIFIPFIKIKISSSFFDVWQPPKLG